MKVGALLCGLLASAFAWLAPYVLADLLPQFLALWPAGRNEQFIALLGWHALIATGVLGGLLCVLTPAAGTLVLLAGAGGWAFLGLVLPAGFSLPVLAPLGLMGLGALLAFGAAIRAGLRRRAAYDDDYDEDELVDAEAAPEPQRRSRLKGLRAMREVEAPPPLSQHAPLAAVAAADEPEAEEEPEAELPPLAPLTPRGAGPDEFDADEERYVTRVVERRGNPVLAVLNLAVLLLLVAAVAVLLYSEYRSGGLSAAFNLPAPDSAAVASLVAVPVDRAAPVPALPALPAEPEIKVSTTPLDFAELSSASWDDPFAYCAAIGTLDRPDRRYDGPALVPAIAAALPSGLPAGTATRWRCVGGGVLVCTAATDAACSKTPSVTEMIAYCVANPDAKGLAAPSGSWSCKGNRPEIPLGQSWPVDTRGFLPGAWVAVAAPAG